MTIQLRSVPRAAGRRGWIAGSARDRLFAIGSPIALLLLWELAARFHVIDARFFPAPTSIFKVFVELLRSGELQGHIWISLQRLLLGVLAGGIPALILGVCMGLNRSLRSILEPLISATYPIPKSAIVPLALLVFGLGEGSKVFMVAIGVFFPVVINATTGVLGIDKIYLDVGRNYHASRWNTFRTIALPGALPVIMTGVRLGIGMGLVLIAVAEMVGAKQGLGYMIWNAWEIFAVEQMYVGLLVIAVIGFGLTAILNELERILVPWRNR
jgi:ABC-type nitrate/sulfonate/bicarbonate transport system permease component